MQEIAYTQKCREQAIAVCYNCPISGDSFLIIILVSLSFPILILSFDPLLVLVPLLRPRQH